MVMGLVGMVRAIITVRVSWLVGIVRMRVRGWGMHYVNEGPYKDRNTRMCVSMCKREIYFPLPFPKSR